MITHFLEQHLRRFLDQTARDPLCLLVAACIVLGFGYAHGWICFGFIVPERSRAREAQ